MGKKIGYVIKDDDGNYVSGNRTFTLTDDGWLYTYYTGDTTGFTYWSRESSINKALIDLQNINKKYNFNRNFHIEYIDLKTVKKGESKTIDAFKDKNDNNNLISA
jgi:hypothetical protein